MHTDDLDYELPAGAIAQTPIEPRDAARLLVDAGPDRPSRDATVAELPELLGPDDLVVLNETRVMPARVEIRRESGGAGEVLLLEPVDDSAREDARDHGRDGAATGWWHALCRPSRRLRVGERVRAGTGRLAFEIGEELGDGRRLVRPIHEGDLHEELERSGVAPLPPYIHERLDDPERYQTVYARRAASAAAPTAGLHLTPAVLDRLSARGIGVQPVELVVGLDTFRPIDTGRVEDHVIHSERYRVPGSTWDAVRRTRAGGGRIVAVGTTTVRALESVAATAELSGRTDLFITPGFTFSVVDVLLTNFHLPRSSLLAMIEAFVGPRWRDLYAEALRRGYRFLSFGDAMLLERADRLERPAALGDGEPT